MTMASNLRFQPVGKSKNCMDNSESILFFTFLDLFLRNVHFLFLEVGLGLAQIKATEFIPPLRLV